jgi:elongation factor Tu
MSAFSRQLWRTSRTALRFNKYANPVQQALGQQGSSKYVNGVRGYAAAFTRDKPHVNIGKSCTIAILVKMQY